MRKIKETYETSFALIQERKRRGTLSKRSWKGMSFIARESSVELKGGHTIQGKEHAEWAHISRQRLLLLLKSEQ